MPASRSAWNGYLKLSFVSCPIALCPATSAAERLSFRQVNRGTGHRLKHKLVDCVTGEEVASSDKARGYETAAAEFLLVEDRDIERRAASARCPARLNLPRLPGAKGRRQRPPGRTKKKRTKAPATTTKSRRSTRCLAHRTRARSRSTGSFQ